MELFFLAAGPPMFFLSTSSHSSASWKSVLLQREQKAKVLPARTDIPGQYFLSLSAPFPEMEPSLESLPTRKTPKSMIDRMSFLLTVTKTGERSQNWPAYRPHLDPTMKTALSVQILAVWFCPAFSAVLQLQYSQHQPEPQDRVSPGSQQQDDLDTIFLAATFV